TEKPSRCGQEIQPGGSRRRQQRQEFRPLLYSESYAWNTPRRNGGSRRGVRNRSVAGVVKEAHSLSNGRQYYLRRRDPASKSASGDKPAHTPVESSYFEKQSFHTDGKHRLPGGSAGLSARDQGAG